MGTHGTVELVQLPVAEWRAYRALRLRAVRDAPSAFGWRYDDLARRPDAYWQGKLAAAAEGRTDWLLFARRGGRLVGVAGAFLDRHHADPHTVDVFGMYVCPEARSQGIGTRLLSGLLELLHHTGRIRRVQLYVNADQEAAVRLYRRLGFSVVRHERGRLGDGRDHDLFGMERWLATRPPDDRQGVPRQQPGARESDLAEGAA